MRAYKDESLLSEIDVNNSIDVGQSVYVAIKQTNNIPGNVEYYLTGCTAYKNFENKTENFFQMIDVNILNYLKVFIMILFYDEEVLKVGLYITKIYVEN